MCWQGLCSRQRLRSGAVWNEESRFPWQVLPGLFIAQRRSRVQLDTGLVRGQGAGGARLWLKAHTDSLRCCDCQETVAWSDRMRVSYC